MMDDLSPNLRLETFWNCLDERQKHDLKQIKSSALIDKQCCKYCQDLLRSSMQSLDKDANIAWHKLSQSHKHYLKIFVTPTGDFVPETSLGQFIEKDEVRPCYSIDVTQGPSYNVNDEAADYIVSGICKSVDPDKKVNSGKKSKKGKKGKGKKGKRRSTNDSNEDENSNAIIMINSPDVNSAENTVGNISKKMNKIVTEGGWEIGNKSCWYCRDKIYIRFIDLLTYPRPIRQFRMLLTKDIPLGELEAIITNDVNRGVPSASVQPNENAIEDSPLDPVILLRRGKKLTGKNKTLGELGLKRNTKLVISREIGGSKKKKDNDAPVDSSEQERNRQFVGDLLFGQDPSEEPTGNSIVESFRLNYGYQILGLLIAKQLSTNVVDAWQAEVAARKSQQDLLNDLLAEETQQTKKASKKQRKKERERKKKEEALRKQKEKEAAIEKERKKKEDLIKAKEAKLQEEKRKEEAEALKVQKAEQQRLWRLEKEQREKLEQVRLEKKIKEEMERKKQEDAEMRKKQKRLKEKELRMQRKQQQQQDSMYRKQQQHQQQNKRIQQQQQQQQQPRHRQQRNYRNQQQDMHVDRHQRRMNAQGQNNNFVEPPQQRRQQFQQQQQQHVDRRQYQQQQQRQYRQDPRMQQQPQQVQQRMQRSNNTNNMNHYRNSNSNSISNNNSITSNRLFGNNNNNNMMQHQNQQQRQQQRQQQQSAQFLINNMINNNNNNNSNMPMPNKNLNLNMYNGNTNNNIVNMNRGGNNNDNNLLRGNDEMNVGMNLSTWSNNQSSQPVAPSTSPGLLGGGGFLVGGVPGDNRNKNGVTESTDMRRVQSLPLRSTNQSTNLFDNTNQSSNVFDSTNQSSNVFDSLGLDMGSTLLRTSQSIPLQGSSSTWGSNTESTSLLSQSLLSSPPKLDGSAFGSSWGSSSGLVDVNNNNNNLNTNSMPSVDSLTAVKDSSLLVPEQLGMSSLDSLTAVKNSLPVPEQQVGNTSNDGSIQEDVVNSVFNNKSLFANIGSFVQK